jgi:hypothetical protein
MLLATVLIELVFAAGFLYIPFIADFLEHAAPTMTGFGVALMAAPAVLAADALHKRLRRGHHLTGNAPAGATNL